VHLLTLYMRLLLSHSSVRSPSALRVRMSSGSQQDGCGRASKRARLQPPLCQLALVEVQSILSFLSFAGLLVALRVSHDWCKVVASMRVSSQARFMQINTKWQLLHALPFSRFKRLSLLVHVALLLLLLLL